MKAEKRRLSVLLTAGAMIASGLVFTFKAPAQVELIPGTYDFGTWHEEAGPKTGKALIVNHGPGKTFIRDVRPSCGCTGSDFMEGDIAPGDTAWVTFTYNPAGRPGSFEKTVKIFTGEDDERSVLRIMGTIIGKPSTLDKYYPSSAGPLRLTETKILFGELEHGTARHYFVRAYNQTADTIYPKMECGEKALSAEVMPGSIPPGEIGTLSFYLNSRHLKEAGDLKYNVTLIPDTLHPEDTYNLEFSARVTPRSMMEDKAVRPKR